MPEDQQQRDAHPANGTRPSREPEDSPQDQGGRWARLMRAMGSPQAGTWVGAVSAAASAVAAIFAAQQASIASEQTRLAAEVPFRQVLFETKLRALDDYRRAVSQYELDIRLGVISLPWAVDTPDRLKAQSNDHMLDNARAARSMIEKYQSFAANSDAAGSQWTQKVRDAMQYAQQLAWANARCFVLLGAHTTATAEYWAELKETAAEPCAELYSRKPHSAFISASRTVEEAMRAELRADTKRDAQAAIQDADRTLRL